jgi:hypothetical protein
MPSRQGSPMRNEEEDASVGGRDGGDLPPPPPPPPPLPPSYLSVEEAIFYFFCRDSRPLRMRDTFVSHFNVMRYTKCRKLHSGVRC